MLAAVQASEATPKRLIAPRYLMRISAPPRLAFFSSAQNDDNHWRPNPGFMAGVVITPLTPGVPQSPESDVQCAVERYHATESLLTDGTNV